MYVRPFRLLWLTVLTVVVGTPGRTVGLMIRACTTAEEIRQKFGIKADLTPEEEEEIKKEYAFLNDL